MSPSVRPRVLFGGDSITDAGRREDPDGWGDGYVRLIAEDPAAASVEVINAGVGGDRVADLRRRWADDVLAARPDVVTVLVGVNDMWRRYDSDDPTTATAFREGYAAVLDATVAAGVSRLVLMEPFFVPLTDDQRAWRDDDLEEKIAVTRSLAEEYSARLVPLDDLFTAAAAREGVEQIVPDGVHPSARGHRMIADEWWRTASDLLVE
ncbi:hypothetical protein E6C70_13030 [Glaciibacter flavus]|uniref:SGNH hydrolase-type esterase domain-containing protein n=1 Tax=Orlajensenia flava TaxID=2565934 RepID=A0A4S4FT00_9MICO|nr:SGNH/GDSL hydrolase family protein [Glaciibacter flavus]THG32656.1 hypothetical protein E6C70_13030 [Glaciibacter flavus]